MQLKQRAFTTLVSIAVCTVFALTAATQSYAQDKKVDPTGTWTWSTPGRDGGEPRTSTLKLKLEGEKLTGTISTPRRQGGETREINIEEAKLKGNEVSFQTTVEFGGNKMVSKYNGKVSGDKIVGKIENAGRDGQTRSRDWEAKREVKK